MLVDYNREGFAELFVGKPSVGGCQIVLAKVFRDGRGVLSQLLSERNPEALHVYYSRTNAGFARDAELWHMHKHHTDRFIVVDGNMVFAISDGADTELVQVSNDFPKVIVVIPPCVYHCVRPANGPAAIMNFPTKVYDPDDELRIPFAKLDAPAPWRM
jgi:dTDP-4-dehydrorhamnose 3,5-epimerase-like enzyme